MVAPAFLALFVLTLFAEVIANDRPLVLSFRGELHFPTVRDYPETRFGGEFETAADYRDPFVAERSRPKAGCSGPPSGSASTP